MPVTSAATWIPTHHRYARWLIIFLTLTAFLVSFSVYFPKRPQIFPLASLTSLKASSIRLKKPDNVKVVAFVFYGRRDRAAVLDCYLKRNLVSNGGWLDEVVWGVKTNNFDDLVYLEQLLLSSSAYSKVQPENQSYYGLWGEFNQTESIYIKVDDDVIYIDDNAIPLLVNTLTTRTEAVLVSANLINSPEFSWLHYRAGAVLPYLPDLISSEFGALSTTENPTWKASELPVWVEPVDFEPPESGDGWDDYLESVIPRRTYHPSGQKSNPHVLPYHRWLPVRGGSTIAQTPISNAQYNSYGRGWWSWSTCAQQHYSFLDHLEHGTTSAYHLMHGSASAQDATWDQTGDRLSINFMAVRGQTILDNLDKLATEKDDESFLTEKLPKLINKRHLVHTKALVSHYTFRPQFKLEMTDLLSRYRAYANEVVCPGSFLGASW